MEGHLIVQLAPLTGFQALPSTSVFSHKYEQKGAN